MTTQTSPGAGRQARQISADDAPDCSALLQALAPHQGAQRGISAAELATRLGTSRRRLRKHISEARCQGYRRFKRPYSVRLKDGLGACPLHAPM